MANYIYNNIDINFKKFDLELKQNNIYSLVDYYTVKDGNITFYTFSDLSTNDENTLSDIVNNHQKQLDYIKDSLIETSSNSTSFIEKIKVEELTENKEYFINWYYEYGASKTNKTIEVIVKINNDIISHVVSESKDTKDRSPCSGRIKRTLPEGLNIITIEYKSSHKNTNAKIRNANLFIEEV